MIKPIKEMKTMRSRYYLTVNKNPGNNESQNLEQEPSYGFTY